MSRGSRCSRWQTSSAFTATTSPSITAHLWVLRLPPTSFWPRLLNAIESGIFDWIDNNRELTLPELYEQRLTMLEMADELGFYCYHLAEHHGTPLGVAPSPNLFLAAAAQRDRVRHLRLDRQQPRAHPARAL